MKTRSGHCLHAIHLVCYLHEHTLVCRFIVCWPAEIKRPVSTLPAELKGPGQIPMPPPPWAAGCSRPAKHLLKKPFLEFIKSDIFEVNQGITWSELLNWYLFDVGKAKRRSESIMDNGRA
ncbi:hypothetical protein NC651_007529 [Populus alba x Populus x berolinensis]|nr:hypothetical protein NC651_007529 [Populus alba x Populus x berolinensis]